jgi:ABC-type multidrug transport system fused ATPase/permease subunit
MWRRPLLAGAFLTTTLVQGTLQGLLIWTLRHVLESFGTPQGVAAGALLTGALMILAVWVLRSFSTFAAETLSVHLAYRVETESMLEILTRLLKLSIRFFDRTSQADVVMASYYDLKGIRAVTLEVGKAVLYLSQLAGLAAAAWLMSPSLAIIGLVSVPLGVLPAYRFGMSITEAARGEREAVTTLHQSFHQVASAIRVIKVNRGQARVLARAQEVARELHHHLIRQAVQKGMARLLLEAVAGIGLVLMLVIGGRDVARGALSWQSLLGLMIAMMAVYSPIVGLVQLYGTIRSVIPSLDRIQTIMREPAEIEDRPGARPLPAAPAVIELRDVTFAYRDRPVLEGVSAVFHRGETIGIVGPSGAGKSTLISLLLRFYDPGQGGIYLDGVDLRDIRHADLMDRSSIVLQEPLLFTDTVANNIRLGRPDATMEQVIDAAKAANIHDEIMEMERGYDTLLGIGRGARGISGGQKQRLAIAAALLKNAPILFLDEATSSLDAVSEQRVQLAIEHLMAGRTTFVIAHRFSTLRKAERILVLDAGRMVGCGSHDQLLATCPTYRALWETQGAPPIFTSPPERTYVEALDG